MAFAGLEFVIFPPQPPKCWDYSCVQPHPAQEVSKEPLALKIFKCRNKARLWGKGYSA
jgi:hypothetical protein